MAFFTLNEAILLRDLLDSDTESLNEMRARAASILSEEKERAKTSGFTGIPLHDLPPFTSTQFALWFRDNGRAIANDDAVQRKTLVRLVKTVAEQGAAPFFVNAQAGKMNWDARAIISTLLGCAIAFGANAFVEKDTSEGDEYMAQAMGLMDERTAAIRALDAAFEGTLPDGPPPSGVGPYANHVVQASFATKRVKELEAIVTADHPPAPKGGKKGKSESTTVPPPHDAKSVFEEG